jgi:peptide deformylase
MSILKVSRLGHPVLRMTSADVDPSDIRAGKFTTLLEDMFETMHAYQGVGLAAPQIHIPLRIFVYEVERDVARRKNVPQTEKGVFFNARFEGIGEEEITDWEGCLSVPFLGGEVSRFRRIRIKGLDAMANPVELEASGYLARIFQHEIDHTDGHVYLDRMPDLTTLGYTVVL